MSCEICAADQSVRAMAVGPEIHGAGQADLCETCAAQIEGTPEPAHWRCLAGSMWSENPAVQVLAWRILDRLAPEEAWAQDLLDQLWLEDDIRAWAEAGRFQAALVHRDSNGTVLEQGDTVTLIKDLPVKGAGFTAKRGTAVRGISLVPDNAAHIEGRVEGQRIVILTEFVKKR
ncbi:MAG: PhnA domain-containing protein [Mangrovicoccus sp.]